MPQTAEDKIIYEYRTVKIAPQYQLLYDDMFKCFGWESVQDTDKPVSEKVRYRRKKYIYMRQDFMRMESNLNECIKTINSVINRKKHFSSRYFCFLSAFSVLYLAVLSFFYFTYLLSLAQYLISIVVIVAFFILMFFVYKPINARKNKKYEDAITEKYIELDMITKKATELIK